MRRLFLAILACIVVGAFAAAAELPIREVILYKHGVGYFSRSGKVNAGETVRLDFKAEDMNDVLKSLILNEGQGGKIGGVRYDASLPLEERLKDYPFVVNAGASLSAFLDQLKGARIELKSGTESVSGIIIAARSTPSITKDRPGDRETVTLMTDAGGIRTVDLDGAGELRFGDPKVQQQLRDYLALVSQARSKDQRSVYIDSQGSGTRDLIASYMAPTPVWKSSYRLLFTAQGDPSLEGWAIIDNTTSDDWNSVRLAVVSGRPISFITPLYEPRYVERPEVDLLDNLAAAPRVFSPTMEAALKSAVGPTAAAPMAKRFMGARDDKEEADIAEVGSGRGAMQAKPVNLSSVAATAAGRDAGALFEYSFSTPVTVKKGQSAMLPFLQQKLEGRKVLIYLEAFGLNPQSAAELTNTTGKTLDGGPITVYDGGSYAGEALVETVKTGDKRLISYGVDLGTRISTAWGSAKTTVREAHLRRGILMTKVATEEVKTYTIRNVDAASKTLLIEHPQRPAFKLLEPVKPAETTVNAYRFQVKLSGTSSQTLAVREERVDDQTLAVASMTPSTLVTWVQNKALTPEAQQQLQQIADKKREIVANDSAIGQTDASLNSLSQDQDRLRRNIDSLRNIQGQSDQVQQYSKQLAANEVKIVGLRNSQGEQRSRKAALEAELQKLIDKAEF